MKLTPLDIHHKEFRRAVRGYNEAEVDQFLDEVADELERLFKENIDLSERLEAAEERVRSYQDMEHTLHNTMVSAQRSAEDIVEKARSEAATILRDAEVKAKEIIHNALTQKQKVQGELLRIKQAEEQFRSDFARTLDGYRSQLAELQLPQDVQVMFGETAEGVVGDVAVEPGSAMAAAEASWEEPAPESAPEGAPESAPATAEFEGTGEGRTVTETTVAEEQPPDPGFVQSFQLGELDTPDLAAEEPVYAEPREFDVPPAASFGERDADVDIEEID